MNPQQRGRGLPALCQSTPYSPVAVLSTGGFGTDSDSGSRATGNSASQHQDRRHTDRSLREQGNTILAQWHQWVHVSCNQGALQEFRWPRPCRAGATAWAFPAAKPIWQISTTAYFKKAWWFCNSISKDTKANIVGGRWCIFILQREFMEMCWRNLRNFLARGRLWIWTYPVTSYFSPRTLCL